ncbi:hypothetical protein ACFW1A_30160 [Kitasatospora sp. NPDC058965]|uniref:hypothetical protein n=1 Tax=Kitasatospora sp. NPDC058965 TaxID=3346682 RepID=UPI003678A78F
MCEHIRAATEPVDYITRYTGVGLVNDRVCPECRDRVADGLAVETAVICEECFDVGEGGVTGVVGMPEVRERPTAVDPTLRVTPVPAELGTLADLAAVDGGTARWLALCEDGRIVRWEPDVGTWAALARAHVEVPADAVPWAGRRQARRLHASPDGRFAAVVLDYGRHGEVFDLSTGTRTMTLDGGDYRPDTVPFSLAFAQSRERTVLVHRTRWNRLDVCDPETGELLTAREIAPAESGNPRPPHYLDYFHGALLVSPDGRHIVDDGWIWSPVGVVTTWNLTTWLDGSPFESEDGATKASLTFCNYHWDRPMTWLDGHRVAIGGLGEDDYDIVPGARVFDVERIDDVRRRPAAETAVFGGPSGRFFSADGLLFSAAPNALEAWDPSDGARLAAVPDFHPTHHHRTARELVQLDSTRLLRWQIDPRLTTR